MTSLAELLSRHPDRLWQGSRQTFSGPRLATGHAELDQTLGGGWPAGAFVEILAPGPGLGNVSLLLPALAMLTRRGETVAWLPAEEAPYAPALLQGEVDPGHVLVLRIAKLHERLWAAEQCLRSGACGALVMEENHRLADPLLRRLKLAAAASDTVLFLLRAAAAASTPSPAPLRLQLLGLPYRRERQLALLKGSSSGTMTLRLHAEH